MTNPHMKPVKAWAVVRDVEIVAVHFNKLAALQQADGWECYEYDHPTYRVIPVLVTPIGKVKK